jgi:hypothetical protein
MTSQVSSDTEKSVMDLLNGLAANFYGKGFTKLVKIWTCITMDTM